MTGIDRSTVGISMATNVETINNIYNEALKPSGRAKGEFLKMNFMVPAAISMTYGLQGVCTQTSFACAAGVIALGDAYRLIKHGYMNMMLCGGADYSVSTSG